MMTTTCGTPIAVGMFVLALLLFGSAGLAYSQPFPETYARPGIAVPQQVGGRFVRTETQQQYYIDSMGRRHLIMRQVVEPSAPLGMLYYIENDNRPYYIDEGQRLYTRDASGRSYYIDDDDGSRSRVETTVIVRGNRSPMSIDPMMQSESCANQYGKCIAGCQGISRRESYTKPMCLNNCETIRNGCRGQ